MILVTVLFLQLLVLPPPHAGWSLLGAKQEQRVLRSPSTNAKQYSGSSRHDWGPPAHPSAAGTAAALAAALAANLGDGCGAEAERLRVREVPIVLLVLAGHVPNGPLPHQPSFGNGLSHGEPK